MPDSLSRHITVVKPIRSAGGVVLSGWIWFDDLFGAVNDWKRGLGPGRDSGRDRLGIFARLELEAQ